MGGNPAQLTRCLGRFPQTRASNEEHTPCGSRGRRFGEPISVTHPSVASGAPAVHTTVA